MKNAWKKDNTLLSLKEADYGRSGKIEWLRHYDTLSDGSDLTIKALYELAKEQGLEDAKIRIPSRYHRGDNDIADSAHIFVSVTHWDDGEDEEEKEILLES